MREIPTLESPITMGAERANMAIICCIRYFQCTFSHTMGPTMVGPGEKFLKNNGSSMAGKRYDEIDFSKYNVS